MPSLIGTVDKCDFCPHTIKENKLPFGNLNVIILGDWGQIPPISGTSLYNNLVKDDIGAQGKKL